MTSTVFPHENPPVGLRRLWAGVLTAPVAWIVAELLGYYLTSRACDRASAATASHAGGTQVVLAVSLGVIALGGLSIAIANWRAVRAPSSAGDPPAWGRGQFMALAGVITSALFVLGIVLFALPPFLVNACDQAR